MLGGSALDNLLLFAAKKIVNLFEVNFLYILQSWKDMHQ